MGQDSRTRRRKMTNKSHQKMISQQRMSKNQPKRRGLLQEQLPHDLLQEQQPHGGETNLPRMSKNPLRMSKNQPKMSKNRPRMSKNQLRTTKKKVTQRRN